MLDENLPTYRFQPSSENPLSTPLFFTHNGSEPSADYVLKRPDAPSSKHQYALALFDGKYASVIYAEVLIKPEWSQPTLSAAEIRAQGGTPDPIPLTPETFHISLYNPDQSVAIKRHQGSWGKSDSWEFEIPERSFKLPSTSQIDQDGGAAPVGDLAPKVVFRWKREGRRDMTCFMSGRSVGGKKSKEPDITVALFRGGKSDSAVTIYEPNMRRVEVEDRKGLEVAFLLSAEVIRDLFISPRQDPFNTAGAPPPTSTAANGRRTNAGPSGQPPAAAMSGALGNIPPSSNMAQKPPPQGRNPRAQAEIDAETKRLQAMVAQEERQAREREEQDKQEQKRIKKMLEQEESERRRREAEVEKETERLRKEYGVTTGGPTSSSPPLPPRPSAGGGWFGPPAQPQRPNSVGPSPTSRPHFAAPPQPQPAQAPPSGGKKKHGNPLNNLLHGSSPYGGPSGAGASVSNFFGRGEDDRKKKVQKKRSVHF